jgi:hypothetical protein
MTMRIDNPLPIATAKLTAQADIADAKGDQAAAFSRLSGAAFFASAIKRR